MSLKFLALEIRVITEEGPYGVILRFNDGLVVLRGENSSGKSTCLAAILYALGLEGLFIRSQDSPFPESMTRRLKAGERWLSVVESSVLLEFAAHDGQVFTSRRSVTGDDKSRQLITVLVGAAITGPSTAFLERRDYFVRVPGAAQSDSGFHFFLADLLGYDLPLVPRFDGQPVPLYLEALFPFVFVDQLRGWTGLATRMPTHFRIVDLWTSAVEFLLALDIQANALRLHELQSEAERLRNQWRTNLEDLQINARGLGFVVQNLTTDPTADWPPKLLPRLSVTEGEGWLSLDQTLGSRRQRLKELEQREIPRIEQVAANLRDAVYEAEGELDRLEQELSDLSNEVRLESDQLEALNVRIAALDEDRRKYKDEQRLRQRGAPGNLKLISHDCPTCKQPLKDFLLPQDAAGQPMTLEDNLRFIEGQLGLFGDIRRESAAILNAKTQRLNAMRQRVADQGVVLRDHKRAFRGDAQAPSVAAIRERLLEEDRIQRLDDLLTRFNESLARFGKIANAWRVNQGSLKAAMRADLSLADRQKLAEIERSLLAQLRAYGFKSFEPEQIKISDETYRPTREGVDLPSAVQMSASDAVRLIWAYLVSLLEAARSTKTHHPGVLVFDEPQQQHMKEISFEALLRRLGPSKHASQQAIIATSENLESLKKMLMGVEAQLIELPDRVLQPLKEASASVLTDETLTPQPPNHPT
jgi:DNA repair exonuclease SbcCD ATPase subunit